MTRLLHDRFVSIGDDVAWDVATGSRVRLRHTLTHEDLHTSDARLGICVDSGATPDGGRFEAWEDLHSNLPAPSQQEIETLVEAFDQGADGEPRHVVLAAPDAGRHEALVRVAAHEARCRGYVPLSAALFDRVMPTLGEALRHRTLALIDVSGSVDDGNVLARASAMNPRPHVLVTILSRPIRRRPWSVVREARAVYAVSDASRHLARAEVAFAAARAGRHAQAERMLREVTGLAARRGAWDSASRVQMMLGRVLLERGRAEAADAVLVNAVEASERSGDRLLVETSRLWLATARIEGDRQTHAEALLRAMRLADATTEGWPRAWSTAVLARCLLAQGRLSEAIDVVSGFRIEPFDGSIDGLTAAQSAATCVEVFVRGGRVFGAGQISSALCDSVEHEHSAVKAIAALAALRVASATGDTSLVTARLHNVLRYSRDSHMPMMTLEARLIWIEVLLTAGRATDARAEHRHLVRLAQRASPFLKRRIEGVLTAAVARPDAGNMPSHAQMRDVAIAMLRAGDDVDDRHALEAITGRLLADLRAARVEIQTGTGQAVAGIVTSGCGVAPKVGVRAIETGIPIGPEERGGVREAAAPVRLQERTMAAIACRWPVGRAAPAAARDLLEIASVIAAPRLASLLQQKEDAAKAALAVPELVGTSDAVEDLRKTIARAAGAPFAVLVEGESGVGKELVARAIHQLSPRRERQFCDLNCAALPDDLLEAELFGHARGAFTGALVERRGLFEEAHGGTVFLDELPDLSLRAQAKLLRVLQDGEVRRVGESFTRHVDIRLVAATNRSMADAVSAGQFRHDLLYRIDVIRIRIPALRERPGDIALLARHFWRDAALRAGTHATLSHGVLAALSHYHWPGNVRELQNVMASLAVGAAERGVVRASQLPAAIGGATVVAAERLADARLQFERRFVEIALARAGGCRTRAAADLGLTRQGLLKLLARLKLAS